ncbi:MAG: type I methionyl aminopeptidase [Dehalococcoidia bacterium]|nr:type I methionyl aminopeptidase [Dehalococcoidia bacterium]
MGVMLKSPAEIALMREAGRIVAITLQMVSDAIRPGVVISELDDLTNKVIGQHNAKPSFKGYRGFPASICVSINEEVVHGIPATRRLMEGDIVSLDVGAIYRGWQGDAAVTVGVGKISDQARKLIDTTRGALGAGIAAMRPGKHLGDVSWAVQSYVESRGFSVVKEYVGHGIGRQMHEDPQIPNFGMPGRGIPLKPGMVLAIEPMVNVGDWRTRILDDHWTVVTADGSLSAHFEHTVAVTENEAEILTSL